jgi:hypothetical protein
MTERPIAVVAIKWGTAFPAEYVNVLYRGVRRNLSRPFTFYCLTDHAEGLDDGIVARPIPDTRVEGIFKRPGCWPKVGVFAPDVFPGHDHALFLDLDLVIRGSLDLFVDRLRSMGGLHIIQEWNPALWSLLPHRFRPDRGAQSSVFGWEVAKYHHLFHQFTADPKRYYNKYYNDQEYIGGEVAEKTYWPVEWTASFKRECVRYYPFNMVFKSIPEPKTATIVVFHGRPRPSDLIADGHYRWGAKRKFGFGPVPWVKRYWFDRT